MCPRPQHCHMGLNKAKDDTTFEVSESNEGMGARVLINKNECAGVEVSWRQERDLCKAMVL